MFAVAAAESIRRAEEATGALLTGGVLMQRAAAAVAAEALAMVRATGDPRLTGRRVLLAVGPGNNGGDALYAGVRLRRAGLSVSAWCTDVSVHEAAWAAFRAAGGRGVDAVGALASLPEVDLVVDGVLGLGGRGGLPPAVATFAQACDTLNVPVLALDLPSGLVADAVTATESFKAAVTVTFGAAKLCHVAQPAAARCGRVRVADIGLGPLDATVVAWEVADVAARWPVPDERSDKYSRGVVGLDTGSSDYPGAAVLSCLGATYAGAGLVRYAGPAAAAVVAALPNVVTTGGRCQAYVLGCGWGRRPDAREVVAGTLASGVPTVVDADALTALPDRVGPRTLLTPHAGELARLLGIDRAAVERDPLGAARGAASRWGAVVLLKGATQVVATPAGDVWLAVPGPAWTAQAGSGDVVAGVAGALLAAGLPVADAALAAASAQALAAARVPGPRPPQDIARVIADVVGDGFGRGGARW